MKREQFIKVLFVVFIMLSMGSTISAFSQSNEQHLSCLKKVYLASDSEVLLDCKPEESKFVSYDRFQWTVHEMKSNGRVGDEIKGCIKKKGGQYFLLPQMIYKKKGEKEVLVAYEQSTNDGRELLLHYRIVVRVGQ